MQLCVGVVMELFVMLRCLKTFSKENVDNKLLPSIDEQLFEDKNDDEDDTAVSKSASS